MTPDPPEGVREQLRDLVDGLNEIYGDALVGVYIHGSLVLGCFSPRRSDIDAIAVTTRPATDDERRRLSLRLPACSAPKAWPRPARCPLELSILTYDDLHPWRHPSPFDVHYSESHLETERGEDADLAAHVTVLRERGVAIAGAPVARVFPEVPWRDYADSLRRDLAWCRETRWKFYSVLSASRIWATLTEGAVHSKLTGALWALGRAPAEARPLIGRALALYRGDVDDVELDAEAANRYVDYVETRLGAARSGSPAITASKARM